MKCKYVSFRLDQLTCQIHTFVWDRNLIFFPREFSPNQKIWLLFYFKLYHNFSFKTAGSFMSIYFFQKICQQNKKKTPLKKNNNNKTNKNPAPWKVNGRVCMAVGFTSAQSIIHLYYPENRNCWGASFYAFV